jgi:hypothetical protein
MLGQPCSDALGAERLRYCAQEDISISIARSAAGAE